jgi:MazG family protein
MAETPGAKLERLLDIMRRLRAPGGCPWDREQTHQSLRPFVLEETYEVLDAIENGTPAQLKDELGDFLFEAVFLAQISQEAGDFDIGDALDAVAGKLVRRHPHVFAPASHDGDVTTAEVVEQWEVLKARERAADGRPSPRKTTLGGVPETLPALLRAYEIGARAAAVGFDWTAPGDVMDKIEEEVAELRQEMDAGAAHDASRAEEEMGDLLFAIANLSRKLGVEPESALRRATGKFTARFDAMERRMADAGKSLTDASLDEMETEWARVKAEAVHRILP